LPQPVHGPEDISPGDIYEDCAYHPCVCLGVDGLEIWGISLVDGSHPRSCDIGACGIRKLTPEEAWVWKTRGPQEVPDEAPMSPERRWW
jgi:hypothetical protein